MITVMMTVMCESVCCALENYEKNPVNLKRVGSSSWTNRRDVKGRNLVSAFNPGRMTTTQDSDVVA